MSPAEINAMWQSLDSERSTVKSLVQQVYDYCLPRRGNVLTKRMEGQDVHNTLYDSTGETAAERFATGMYNFMWNPSRTNFMLLPPIEGSGIGEDISHQLLGLTELIKDEMSASNFEEAFFEDALDTATAGTATLEPGRGDKTLFEFTCHPFEQIVFSEDQQGRVGSVLRQFEWTAEQMVEEFGLGRVPPRVVDAYKTASGKQQSFPVTHAAVPRRHYPGGPADVENMPIASTWISGEHVLRRSGWPEQRYLVSRFTKAAGEKYGRSCGMTALPDMKMVNKIEETIIAGAEMVVRPPILVPDGSFIGDVSLDPASLLYYRVNPVNPLVKPEAFQSGARVDFGHEYAESKRDIIKRVFYNDLFLILGDEKRRTATEVRSIMAEKMSMLGPSFGRMKVELFDPMIRVLMSIASEVPEYLHGIPLGYLRLANIRYISTLAIAMQYAELSLVEDALIFLSPLGELDPTIFDNLSFDEITRGFLEKMAWPVKWLKARDEVRALREARAERQAQQMMQMQAMQQMQLMGGPKRPEEGSPARALMEAA
jgi:hypothetical protein